MDKHPPQLAGFFAFGSPIKRIENAQNRPKIPLFRIRFVNFSASTPSPV